MHKNWTIISCGVKELVIEHNDTAESIVKSIKEEIYKPAMLVFTERKKTNQEKNTIEEKLAQLITEENLGTIKASATMYAKQGKTWHKSWVWTLNKNKINAWKP